MTKRRTIVAPGLMIITLFVITCFQAWWLKNNYDKEKLSIEIRSGAYFQETVRKLQIAKLKLKDPFFDTAHKPKTRIFVDENIPQTTMKEQSLPREEVITMVNAMRDKLKDSLKETNINSAVIISMNKDSKDSSKKIYYRQAGDHKPTDIFQVLYGIDSLQDSVRVSEIRDAYSKKLKEQDLNLPFNVIKSDTPSLRDGRKQMSEATVGFVHPVTYRLELGNIFPFVIKKIFLLILFSFFLVGVSIFSFLLLYRNMIKQQRLAEIKNEFISNITHELKTPIATVGVAIEALKNFNAMHDPQKTKEYLDISSQELQRLSLLVDKVLKLSMFEKKEIELKYEILDLKDILDEVISSMRLQIEKHHAKVLLTTEGDVTLEGDRLHLLSVVFNLVDNALKYSDAEPSIQIQLKGNENTVELNIIDNGIGISPEYKEKIFEKFFRVPTGDKHNAKGYGLGLSYAAHVIYKHQGQIAVESQPGIGTKFTITLPKHHA